MKRRNWNKWRIQPAGVGKALIDPISWPLCRFMALMNRDKAGDVTGLQHSAHEVVWRCLQPETSPEASAAMFQNKSEAWLRWVVHEDQRVKREKSLFWALCRDAAWPIEVKGMNGAIHWV